MYRSILGQDTAADRTDGRIRRSDIEKCFDAARVHLAVVVEKNQVWATGDGGGEIASATKSQIDRADHQYQVVVSPDSLQLLCRGPVGHHDHFGAGRTTTGSAKRIEALPD